MTKPLIFISYSRKDERIQQSLLTHLNALVTVGKAEIWVDNYLEAGSDWLVEIEKALSRANIAILLITENFLVSKFINDTEVPQILHRRVADGLIVIPLIAKSCSWTQVDWLNELNVWPRGGIPFWDNNRRRGTILTQVTDQVAEIIHKIGGHLLHDDKITTNANKLGSYNQKPVLSKNPNKILNLVFDIELIAIKSGNFIMGSNANITAYSTDESPQHTLQLPDYYLSKTCITNQQYAEFVKNSGYQPPRHWDSRIPSITIKHHPVVNISYFDALAYCRWISGVSGVLCSLPSEAEWEKGARGGDGRTYPWGSKWDNNLCNSLESGYKKPLPVGYYPDGQSPYGLLDMVGNVWEWTKTLWGEDIHAPTFKYNYNINDGREDIFANENIRRIVRGGSCFYSRNYVRCASRASRLPNDSSLETGFRISASL